jgi:predicted AlkP superfamily phosphohydrolase/phosphomutase
MSKRERIVVIGLDGGTWEILDPLIASGRAPFFGGLAGRGASGNLISTLPPVTAPAWTSFLTGKNPGKHGLFDFQRIEFGRGERKLTFSTDCKSPTMLDYLGHAGWPGVFVNIPLTFPPRPVNGVMVAGFPVPPGSRFVYPPEMQDRVAQLGYKTDWFDVSRRRRFGSRASMIAESDASQIRVFGTLLKEAPWDVAMIVVSGTDHIAHVEWQKGNVKGVSRHYEFVDRQFSALARQGLFDGANIMVVSDHGFSGGSHAFFMNTWLRHAGHLAYGRDESQPYDIFLERRNKLVYGERRGVVSRLLRHTRLTRENVIFLAKRSGLIRLEQYLPHSLAKVFPTSDRTIDWSRTRAYMMSNASKGINVNLKGREKTGIVPLGEYEAVRQDIIGRLRALRDEEGQPVFRVVEAREKVYQGPHVEDAPDIVTWPTPKYKIRIGADHPHYIRRVIEAQHAIEGIFIFSGPGFRTAGRVGDLSIMDIAPTLLHVGGLAVPDDLDGRVATELLRPDSDPGRRPVATAPPGGKYLGEPGLTGGEGEGEDDRVILEKLRALGYIE